MICYKDRSFCSSDCIRTDCYRFAGDGVHRDAAAAELPISFLDYSGICELYVPPNGVERQ